MAIKFKTQEEVQENYEACCGAQLDHMPGSRNYYTAAWFDEYDNFLFFVCSGMSYGCGALKWKTKEAAEKYMKRQEEDVARMKKSGAVTHYSHDHYETADHWKIFHVEIVTSVTEEPRTGATP